MEEKLREAAALRDHDAVKLLLDGGANINDQNRVNGWTALHWAAKRGDATIVETLLGAGADLNVREHQGLTASQVAEGDNVRALLGIDQEPSSSVELTDSTVGFTPNYLKNPTLHKDEYYKQCLPSVSQNFKRQDGLSSPPAKREFFKAENVLILKARIEGQRDFIEVDLALKNLDMQSLVSLLAMELETCVEKVSYIRKLPNTKMRRDLDVRRLKEYQELELVVDNN